MGAGWRAVVVLGVLVAACSSGDADFDARDISAVRTFEIGAGRWAPAPRPWTAGPQLASDCGATRATTEMADADADAGAARTVASPVYVREYTQPGGDTAAGPGGPFARVAALQYGDEATARTALASIGPRSLERCITRSVNAYLRSRDPKVYGRVEPATAKSFDTKIIRRAASETSIVQSRFDALVLGGYDDTEILSFAACRSGDTLVTVATFDSMQSPTAADVAHDAEFAARTCERLRRAI